MPERKIPDTIAGKARAAMAAAVASLGSRVTAVEQSFSEFMMSYVPNAQVNAPVTKTAAYSADVLDSGVLCDTTAGTFAVTLPTGAVGGKEIDVKWIAGTVAPTVLAPAGGSISDGSPFTIPALKASITFQARGSNVWDVI